MAAAAAALMACGLAGAQPGPRLTITPQSAHVGRSVTLKGYGFRPRLDGIVVFGAKRVATFRAGARGRFILKFVVPAGTSHSPRVVAEQRLRGQHGSFRRLSRATIIFRVLGAVGNSIVGGPGGSGAPNSGAGAGSGGSSGAAPGSRWAPPRQLTWYWQLQGTINNGEPVAAYDIDGFDNSASEIATLHGQGKHVICYIDAGTYEPGRSDSSHFSAGVLGSGVEGWPGEQWLDIRNLSVLEPIMTARFEVCKAKGFDAVEPDNMDGYENKTGFPLTAAEQLTYDEWIANEVHALGMAVFQKNDGEQTAQLVSHFDGALDEQCNQYSECSNFQAYLSAGKPVLNAEYELSASSFCAADNAAGIMGARYGLELDGKTFEPCW